MSLSGKTTRLFIIDNIDKYRIRKEGIHKDKIISFKAKGIHSLLTSITEPMRLVTMPDLSTFSNEGEHAIRSGLKELLAAKYLHFAQIRNDKGQIKGTVYVCSLIPAKIPRKVLISTVMGSIHKKEKEKIKDCKKSPYGGFPHTGNPRSGFAKLDRIYDISLLRKDNNLNYNLNINPNGLKLNYNLAASCPQKFEKRAISLFDHWNKQESLPNHRKSEKYKCYRFAMKALAQTLRKHSSEVIAKAIENYAWLLSQPYTIIRSKNSPMCVGLDEFFKFNTFSNTARSQEKHPLREIDSWFAECCKGKEYLLNRYSVVRKDKNPDITRNLIHAVVDSGLFGLRNINELDTRDTNMFILASSRLADFMKSNSKYVSNRNNNSGFFIRKLLNSLNEMNKPLHLGYLTSDITWRNLKTFISETGGVVDNPRSSSNGFRKVRDHAISTKS